MLQAVMGQTTPSLWGLTAQMTGTNTAATFNNASKYTSVARVDVLVTAASTTAVAGIRHNEEQFWRGNSAGFGGFLFVCRFGISTGTSNSTRRAFVGLRSSTGAPTDVEPSSHPNVLGFGYDAADTAWTFMHKTGSGTVVKETIGSVNFARPTADNTDFYEAIIHCDPNGSAVGWRLTNLRTGVTNSGTVSSDLPASATGLSYLLYTSVGGTSAVTGLSLMGLYVRTDC